MQPPSSQQRYQVHICTPGAVVDVVEPTIADGFSPVFANFNLKKNIYAYRPGSKTRSTSSPLNVLSVFPPKLPYRGLFDASKVK